MRIRREDYLPACTEYVDAELPPLIVDADGIAAAIVKGIARTKGAGTDAGDCICSSYIDLGMVGERHGRPDDDRDDCENTCGQPGTIDNSRVTRASGSIRW